MTDETNKVFLSPQRFQSFITSTKKNNPTLGSLTPTPEGPDESELERDWGGGIEINGKTSADSKNSESVINNQFQYDSLKKAYGQIAIGQAHILLQNLVFEKTGALEVLRPLQIKKIIDTTKQPISLSVTVQDFIPSGNLLESDEEILRGNVTLNYELIGDRFHLVSGSISSDLAEDFIPPAIFSEMQHNDLINYIHRYFQGERNHLSISALEQYAKESNLDLSAYILLALPKLESPLELDEYRKRIFKFIGDKHPHFLENFNRALETYQSKIDNCIQLKSEIHQELTAYARHLNPYHGQDRQDEYTKNNLHTRKEKYQTVTKLLSTLNDNNNPYMQLNNVKNLLGPESEERLTLIKKRITNFFNWIGSILGITSKGADRVETIDSRSWNDKQVDSRSNSKEL